MLRKTSPVFCDKTSKVHEIFQLNDLNISTKTSDNVHNNQILVNECDIIISVTNGNEIFYFVNEFMDRVYKKYIDTYVI